MTPEKRKAAEAFLDDGAPFSEIAETLHVDRRALSKAFPGRGWSKSEGGLFSAETRATARALGITADRRTRRVRS